MCSITIGVLCFCNEWWALIGPIHLLQYSLYEPVGEIYGCTSYCTESEVTCLCHPSSRYFNWIVRSLSSYSYSIAFANNPNGTMKTREPYRMTATVVYAGNAQTIATLSFLSQPELIGATIWCDGYSTTFQILGKMYSML